MRLKNRLATFWLALVCACCGLATADEIRLTNLATRGFVGLGENVLIGGLVIAGTEPKTVLIRAMGPTLTGFGVPGALGNPELTLFQGATVFDANDDWANHPNNSLIPEDLKPANPNEAAIVRTLLPGAYTAIVTGADNTQGVGLVEAFELGLEPGTRFRNLATRGFVGPGDNVLIGGLVLLGTGTRPLVIRAKGPSLADEGVIGPLQDPKLLIFKGSELIAQNDNWSDHPQAHLIPQDLVPENPADAAIYIELGTGPHTAIVSGSGADTGVGLVEIFEVLPPPPVVNVSNASGLAREMVELRAEVDNPSAIERVSWFQFAGPTMLISGETTLTATVTLPDVDVPSIAGFIVEVVLTGGTVITGTLDVLIEPNPLIADKLGLVADATLAGCLQERVNQGVLLVSELITLTCSGVADLSGIDSYTALSNLVLVDSTVSSVAELFLLPALSTLDISGNPGLSCVGLDQLRGQLGNDLVADERCVANRLFDLGAAGDDIQLGPDGNRAYISVPSQNEIVVVQLDEFRISDRLTLPGEPRGLSLSIDGQRLFAALNGANSIVEIDLATRDATIIPMGEHPGHPSTWDVIEAAPNRLFVSANPSSSGLATIADINLSTGFSTTPESLGFVRAHPVFARDTANGLLYIGSGFSPNSLFKVKIEVAGSSLVLEDDHGSVSGTDNLVLNQDASRIALGSGQVLRTGSFIAAGNIDAGPSVAGQASNTLHVVLADSSVKVFDFDSLALQRTVDTGCELATPERIAVYGNDQNYLVLRQNQLCVFAEVSGGEPLDPLEEFRFPDLGLESCVIDLVNRDALTDVSQIVSLDCTGSLLKINSLAGIERLVNLESLSMVGGGLLDLAPLADLDLLSVVSLRDSRLSDVSGLLGSSVLVALDVLGNPSIPCAQLSEFESSGVTVTANHCTMATTLELGGLGASLVVDSGVAIVSVPSLNQVLEVDLNTNTVIRRHDTSSMPQGIALSNDRATIYAALNGNGSLAVINRATGQVDTLDMTAMLGSSLAWDVALVSESRLLVSGNPGSSGIAYIVEVRTDLANRQVRVAGNTIIRAAPVFAVSPDSEKVYVGEGFSPESVYLLDATLPDLPIVAEDEHGEVFGTGNLVVSPDGNQLFLTSGQILNAMTLTVEGNLTAGLSALTLEGDALLVYTGRETGLDVYDIETRAKLGERQWGCRVIGPVAIAEPEPGGVMVLGDDLLCASRVVAYP